jgi:hypothetical protein
MSVYLTELKQNDDKVLQLLSEYFPNKNEEIEGNALKNFLQEYNKDQNSQLLKIEHDLLKKMMDSNSLEYNRENVVKSILEILVNQIHLKGSELKFVVKIAVDEAFELVKDDNEDNVWTFDVQNFGFFVQKFKLLVNGLMEIEPKYREDLIIVGSAFDRKHDYNKYEHEYLYFLQKVQRYFYKVKIYKGKFRYSIYTKY